MDGQPRDCTCGFQVLGWRTECARLDRVAAIAETCAAIDGANARAAEDLAHAMATRNLSLPQLIEAVQVPFEWTAAERARTLADLRTLWRLCIAADDAPAAGMVSAAIDTLLTRSACD